MNNNQLNAHSSLNRLKSLVTDDILDNSIAIEDVSKLLTLNNNIHSNCMLNVNSVSARPGKMKLGLSFGISKGEAVSNNDNDDVLTERKHTTSMPASIHIHGRRIDTSSQDIYLSYLELTSLPTELEFLTPINLSISHNKLTTVNNRLSSNTNTILSLDISNNLLTRFNSDVQSKLTSIASLNLSKNRLNKFPVDKGMMPNLVTLNIVCNCVTIIPAYISQTKLQRLYIEWKVFRNNADSSVFIASLDQVNNNSICFDNTELRVLTEHGNRDISCNEYVGQRFIDETPNNYFLLIEGALRLRCQSIVQTLIDLRPKILIFKAKGAKKSIISQAVEIGDDALIQYLRVEHKSIINDILNKDHSSDILLHCLRSG